MLELLSVIIVVVVSSSLGLVTYYNNPKSATNRIFSLFAASIIFWAIIMFLTLQPYGHDQVLFLIRLSMLAAIAMSTCVLFLSHTIPSHTFRMKKRYAIPLFIFACLGMATAMSPFMFTGLEIEGANLEPIAGPGMLMFLATGLGYSISGIGILLRKYLKSQGRERAQFRYVLLGITLMHALLIWANFIVVLVFKSSDYMNLGPLFTLTFLISTAYAIIKHRLLDIRFVVARTISFVLLTALLAGIYGLALFQLPAILPPEYQIPAYILVAIIMAYTFVPLRRLVEHLSDSIFHRQPYSSERFLSGLGKILRSTLEIGRLSKQVSTELLSTLQVQYVAFVVLTDTGPAVINLTGHRQKLPLTDNTLHNLITSADYKLLLYDDLDESPAKMLLRSLEAGAILPLTIKSTHHGLIILGQKASGETYTNQDIDVLNILLPQLSIAVQNAKSFDEISKFNVKLKEEIDKATSDLKSANKHLKHLDQLKDEFVFIATHELKNPVTAMRGYLSMINEGSFGEVPKPMHEAVQQLTLSNQQLVDLVNDLLQIARAEAKTITVTTEPVDLKKVVDDVIEAEKPMTTHKALTINHEAPLPMVVKADPQRLKEVVQNLLSNAIKYSNQGTITITHDVSADKITTNVIDQGRGIGPEDQKKLFSRFFRSDDVASAGIPGTGLGLFIVKQLVERMGGAINFTSEPNVGSTFSFSLPRLG
jgi:signal transduction histidine kinase